MEIANEAGRWGVSRVQFTMKEGVALPFLGT
jgi:hypothetical protein